MGIPQCPFLTETLHETALADRGLGEAVPSQGQAKSTPLYNLRGWHKHAFCTARLAGDPPGPPLRRLHALHAHKYTSQVWSTSGLTGGQVRPCH